MYVELLMMGQDLQKNHTIIQGILLYQMKYLGHLKHFHSNFKTKDIFIRN
jgi:hypothetical protein